MIYQFLDWLDTVVEQWHSIIIEKIVYVFTHNTIICALIGIIFPLIILLVFLIAENNRLTEERFRKIEEGWDGKR